MNAYKEHKLKPPDERRQHALFRWPDAMERGDLPWEATRPMLDLLRMLNDTGMGRPTVHHARWYWRVYLAAPDKDSNSNWFDALLFAAAERKRVLTGKQPDMDGLEYYLAYAPWREENKNAYEHAKSSSTKTLQDTRGVDDVSEEWVKQLPIPDMQHTVDSIVDDIPLDVVNDMWGDLFASQDDASVRLGRAKEREDEGQG